MTSVSLKHPPDVLIKPAIFILCHSVLEIQLSSSSSFSSLLTSEMVFFLEMVFLVTDASFCSVIRFKSVFSGFVFIPAKVCVGIFSRCILCSSGQCFCIDSQVKG